MKRREAAVGLTALCALIGASRSRAQGQPIEKVYRVAALDFAQLPQIAALKTFLVRQLRTLGYVDGQNLVLDLRSLHGLDPAGQDAVVAEVVSLGPNVICVPGTATAVRVAKATNNIPIVMWASVDPVGAGLAQSLARPGGNVTGLVTDVDAGAEEKRLELLLEMVPKAHRIAFLGLQVDWENVWGKAIQSGAAKRDVKLLFVEGKRTDFSGALETLRREKADAFFVALSPLTTQFASSFGEFTVANRLPSSCAITEMVDRGCLMAYGQSVASVIGRSLTYVDRILKGAKPGDLPIEQPRDFHLVINVRTAKAIGLQVPQSILLRADRAIE